MTHCEDCGELVCSCAVDELQEESLKDLVKPFRFEYAFEALTEQGHTQFHRNLPDYE